jgi:hypothetical protein
MSRHLTGFVGALLATALTACGEPSLETRTFDLQHLDPQVAYEIVFPYVYLDRPQDPGTLSYSRESRTLAVRERPDNLDQIARVLEERDSPRPGVALYFQVIDAVGDAGVAPDPKLAEVESALREVFRFRSYRLVGEAVVRASDRSDFSQRIAGPAAHAIKGRLWSVQSRDDGQLSARLTVEFWSDQHTSALETTVNLVDGRTLVLGTAGGRGDESALILAVRPVFEP